MLKYPFLFFFSSFLIFPGILTGSLSAEENLFVTGGTAYYQWGKVLKKYVDDKGLVDYAKLKTERWVLDPLIHNIKNEDVDSLSIEEQKAFWINTYNAVTMWVVRDAYPVKSIRQINMGFVWKKGREIARKKYSLDHIEHKILRPMGDPRIHFALNCASIGCPELPRTPFYPERLDDQLEQAAKNFINNPNKVRLDRSTNTLYYSAIFNWFEKDFLKVAPDILNFVKKYINEEDKTYLERNTVEMKVLKYDWGLNAQE